MPDFFNEVIRNVGVELYFLLHLQKFYNMNFIKPFVVILIVQGLFACANTPEKSNVKAENKVLKEGVSLSTHAIDYNVIERDIPAVEYVILTNNKKSTLTGLEVSSSCGCTLAKLSKTSVDAGDTALITVTYDARIPGLFSKDVYVNYYGQDSLMTINVSGHTRQ